WSYGPEICLCVFAVLGAVKVKKMEKASGKEIFWAQSLVMTFLVGFGGGILAPFLLGKPPVMLVNDLIVPVVFIAWFLVARAEPLVFAIMNTPVVSQVIYVLGEVFRGNTLCGVVAAANKAIDHGKYYPIPVWGPIVLGTIAGCGGMFLPFDKGLAGIKGGAPWPLQSAFYCAFVYHLGVNDPNVTGFVSDKIGPYSAETVKTLVVGFLCTMTLAQSYIGEAFNPFTPVHKVIYTVSGIPDPSAPPAKKESKTD
ncbi:unnamed protein product, partial [Chrysoparadoxa australica]